MGGGGGSDDKILIMEETPHLKKPELDDVSREAYKLFETHQVNELQEALHIDRALKLFEKYREEGILDDNMTLPEIIERLARRGGELIGEEEVEDD